MADLNISVGVQVEQGEQELVKLRKSLRDLQDQSRKLTSGTAEYDERLVEIGNKKRDIAALSQSLGDLKKAFDKRPIEAVDNEVKDLNKDLLKTTAELEKLASTIKRPETAFDTFFKKVAESQEQIFGPFKEGLGIAFAVKAVDLLVDSIGNLSQEIIETAKEVREINKELVSLGVTGQDVSTVLTNTFAISKTTGKEAGDIIAATNALVKQFGISWAEASVIIEKANVGILGTTKDFEGELVKAVDELNTLGFTANETRRIFEEFQRKGFDFGETEIVLQTFTKNFTDNTDDIRLALTNAFGAEFAQKLFQDFRSGIITGEQALETISQKFVELQKTTTVSKTVQTQLNEAFGTQSFAAFNRFSQSIVDAQNVTANLTLEQQKLLEQNLKLNNSNKELAVAYQNLNANISNGATIGAAWNSVVASIINFLAEAIKTVKIAGLTFSAVIADIVILAVEFGKAIINLDFTNFFDNINKGFTGVEKTLDDSILEIEKQGKVVVDTNKKVEESTKQRGATTLSVTKAEEEAARKLAAEIKKLNEQAELIKAGPEGSADSLFKKLEQDINALYESKAFRALTQENQAAIINRQIEDVEKILDKPLEDLRKLRAEIQAAANETAIRTRKISSDDFQGQFEQELDLINQAGDERIRKIKESDDYKKLIESTNLQDNLAAEQLIKNAREKNIFDIYALEKKFRDRAIAEVRAGIEKEANLRKSELGIKSAEAVTPEVQKKGGEAARDQRVEELNIQLQSLQVDREKAAVIQDQTAKQTALNDIRAKEINIQEKINEEEGKSKLSLFFDGEAGKNFEAVINGIVEISQIANQAINEAIQANIDGLTELQTKNEEVIAFNQQQLSTLEGFRDEASARDKQRFQTEIDAIRKANIQKIADNAKVEKTIQAEKRKQARISQGIALGQALINGALAVTQAFAQLGPIAGAIAAAIVAATVGFQVAAIARQKFAQGGLLEGPSHAQGGIPIEAEGGEVILNKNVAKDPNKLALANYLNTSTGGRPLYKYGGVIPKAQAGLFVPKQLPDSPFTNTSNNGELLDRIDQLIKVNLLNRNVAVTEFDEVQNRVDVIETRNRY